MTPWVFSGASTHSTGQDSPRGGTDYIQETAYSDMIPENKILQAGQVLMVTEYPWGLEFEVVQASSEQRP